MSATLAAPAPAWALADRLAEQVGALLRDGRAEEALPMLDRLGLLAAPHAPALRAEAMLQLRRLEEAEAAADAALSGAAPGAGLRRLRARIRLARGRHAAAAEDAASAVMAEPHDTGGRLLLAAALTEEGRHDEAIWFLGEAWRADPGNPVLQRRLGEAFLRAGRHEAAAELLAHCEALAPWTPGIAALRAQAALLAGDAVAAERMTRGAMARGVVEAALHSVLGHALVAQGRLAEAGPHFAAAGRLAPGNGYIAHLAAAADGTAQARAPEAYVATLFDGYAPHFEAALLGLGYRVPGLVRRAVERLLPAVVQGEVKLGPVLDLGCGTGLVGVALSDLLHGPLTGIDLSRRMLEQAAAKGLYTSLRQADLTAALREAGTQALITAADVFCYLGELREVLALCRERLAPEGLLLFSLERAAPGTGWRLGPEGRYAHAPDHVAACLEQAGLHLLEACEEDLRLGEHGPVPGLLVAARAAGS
ncbi:tetratricopeptide repeat protein [Roseicella aquatilis]|uniref:Tetratricopeptide repeat protein n=1 Tax=Roseicella aquatilis TaxID=2527868 RepID=A0A4R4D4D0_9PROT|nr:methyltransferase domain-containing protein [Roseicella aquatilis]TCZ51095.1 tetratricopeptide repeat protein [Roseicella aquatilis]